MQFLSRSEFAKLKGWHPSTVTRFAHAGKIVFSRDGRVDVEATEALLSGPTTPQGEAQKQRHARDRALNDGAEPKVSAYATEAQINLQQSRAQAEAHRAALLKIELDEKCGRLGDVEAMKQLAYKVSRATLAALLNLPHRLDPILAAESDPGVRFDLWDREIRAAAEEIAKLADAHGADGRD